MFQAPYQPGLPGQSAAFNKIFKPDAKIRICVHYAFKDHTHSSFLDENALAQDLGYCPVRSPIIAKILPQNADQLPASSLSQPHAAVRRTRPKVNQNAAGLKYPVRFVEGMNHARMSHSSENPGKYDYIEHGRWIFEMFRLAYMVSDTLGVTFRFLPAGLADQPRLWVHGLDPFRAQ